MADLTEKKPKIKVYLVEDHDLLRQEIVDELSNSKTVELLANTASGATAMRDILELQPDVAIVDLHLPDCGGIDVIEYVRENGYEGVIIVFTSQESSDSLFNALSAGASGYLIKHELPLNKLTNVICDAVTGCAPMTRSVARRVVGYFGAPKRTNDQNKNEAVSQREQEILFLLGKGYSTKEVSNMLSISYQTVRTHQKNIYRKLRVNSVTEAIAVHKQGS